MLKAPSQLDRRALLDALKASKSHVHIHFHLSSLGQANKTLVYHLAKKNQVHIKDHGDIVHLAWKQNPSEFINLEILKTSDEVLARLHTFFGTRPKN